MPPRKKPVVAPEPTPEVTTSSQEQPSPIQETVPTKPKAKREKKSSKHKVVAVVTPEGIQGVFQPEVRRPLIVHLPIHSNDVQFHEASIITYDPNLPPQPEAFDAAEVNPFAQEAMYDSAPIQDVAESVQEVFEPIQTSIDSFSQPLTQTQAPLPQVSVPPQTLSRKEYGPTQLLIQHKSSKHTYELPSQTDLSCFWCCESFSGRPCVIPSFVVNETWHVYGNFCTPQCAMSYLLSEIVDMHTRWERIALLNRLYGAQMNGRIYPAPAREILQRFGGPMTIEEFRLICEKQRIRVDIHIPPMVSILASMDTKPIDFYETPLRNTFASPNSAPITRSLDESHGLKLRRSKPLKDKESTLDSCLEITIK
jgi:hypothetical protein